VVLILYYAISPTLNWISILNAGDDLAFKNELNIIALIVFTFFCINFIFKLITTVLVADQKPAIASLFDLLSKIIVLISIYILTKTTSGSLLYLGFISSSVPVMVLLLSSIWFYSGNYKKYKPSLKYVDLNKAPNLLNLGVKFFVIQIAVILLYQTNNIIISHLFGPAQVTPYNVAYKYFSVIMMGFTTVITPFWSAFTEAWVKNEISWIRTIMHKLLKIWALLVVIAFAMVMCSNWIYEIWLDGKVIISYSISILVAIFIILYSFTTIFAIFLNGLGKIKIQVYIAVYSATINIPLAIFLGSRIGIEGILIANIVVQIFGVIIYPIQYNKLINNTAKGVWKK